MDKKTKIKKLRTFVLFYPLLYPFGSAVPLLFFDNKMYAVIVLCLLAIFVVKTTHYFKKVLHRLETEATQ